MSINQVTFAGRMGGDPETRTAQNGTFVLSGSVVVTEKRPEGYDSVWVPFKMFGHTAEQCAKVIKKNTKVRIFGKLVTKTAKSVGFEILAYRLELIQDFEEAMKQYSFLDRKEQDVDF